MESYTPRDRRNIAGLQYRNYKPSDKAYISGHEDPIGIVRRVITDDTGLNAYVIEDPKTGHVTVLYRDSEGPGKPGSKVGLDGEQFLVI